MHAGDPSSVRGGTVIASDVHDRHEHTRRLADPDVYRQQCRSCCRRMHAHGTRTRRPVGEVPLEIRRYICPGCGGVVQIVPAFLARHFWRCWPVVEAVVVDGADGPPKAARVAPRTRRRWRARAKEPARIALHALSAERMPRIATVLARIGLDATRGALLAAFRPLASALGACALLANLLNLIRPGLRIM
jgi:hypothetical protein